MEKAIIFFRSFCVKAQAAVKKVVSAPNHRQRVEAAGEASIKGLMRMSKKIPATTMVLECKRDETGVGPSIAAGSQGWSPNCADLPVAAIIKPTRTGVTSMPLASSRISWICQVLNF